MTREDVAELKRQWLADPCWDIEDTEGFSEYAEELKHYRWDVEAEWAANRQVSDAALVESLGLDASNAGHMKLAKRIQLLEARIAKLEDAAP